MAYLSHWALTQAEFVPWELIQVGAGQNMENRSFHGLVWCSTLHETAAVFVENGGFIILKSLVYALPRQTPTEIHQHSQQYFVCAITTLVQAYENGRLPICTK